MILIGDITIKLTGPGVDVDERSERATMFRLRFSVLLAGNHLDAIGTDPVAKCYCRAFCVCNCCNTLSTLKLEPFVGGNSFRDSK